MLRVFRLAGAIAIAAAAGSCGGPSGPSTPTGPAAPSVAPVLVGAGDIAVCGSRGAEATAALLDAIPGTVFTAGDNAYYQGSAADFRDCYDPTWGRHRGRTRPAPGNHDYETAGGAPYFGYFGDNAGTPGLGYYSFDIGAWHILSLNTNVPIGPGSAQYEWVREDVEARRPRCLGAIWHHPLFSSGPNGGYAPARDVWRLLEQNRAEFVITGHEHFYERFAPLDSSGRPTPDGIRQFTAGTGGAPLSPPGRLLPGSEARAGVWGVLKLTLNAEGYGWEFLSTESRVLDSGSGPCR